MTERKVWATSEDGSIEYISLTKDLVDAAIHTMQKSFYINENVCVAFDVPNEPEAYPELDVLLYRAAKDGVSVAAVDKSTGKVVGAAFNKLEEPGQSTYFVEYAKSCKYPASKGVSQWMLDIESMFDIFEHCKVNSVMEIMFLGILPEFRRRGIAKKLFEVSIDIAKKLKNGDKVQVSMNSKVQGLAPQVQLVTGIFTSFVTQRIAKDLCFEVATKIDFDSFVYDGKSLGSIIGQHTPYLTYEYLKL